MTATAPPRGRHSRPEDDTTPTLRPSLLRAELLRLRSRRLLRVLLALVVLGWVGATLLAGFTHEKTTPAALDEARAQIAQIVADNTTYRDQCLAAPPDGDATACGEPTTADMFDPADFVATRPFSLRTDGSDGVLAFGAGLAVLGVVAGATWIGAEWSSRSMVNLLFWDPRRWRVHLVKAGVITAAAVVVTVIAQALWTVSAYGLAALRGSSEVPDGFLGHLLAAEARSVALVAATTLIGYAVAGLVRNTGATLGVAFVYFAVVETALRGLWQHAQGGLLTTNAIALVKGGGLTYYTYEDEPGGDAMGGFYGSVQVAHHVTNLQGGLVLGGIAVVLVAVAGLVLARRDVQ